MSNLRSHNHHTFNISNLKQAKFYEVFSVAKNEFTYTAQSFQVTVNIAQSGHKTAVSFKHQNKNNPRTNIL